MKVDIFTLGMMLFLLAFGQMPFVAATPDDKYYQYIIRGDLASFVKAHPATAKLA